MDDSRVHAKLWTAYSGNFHDFAFLCSMCWCTNRICGGIDMYHIIDRDIFCSNNTIDGKS